MNRLLVAVALCGLLVGCGLSPEKQDAIEQKYAERFAKLDALAEKSAEHIANLEAEWKAGKLPVEEGLAAIETAYAGADAIREMRDELTADMMGELKSADWWTRIDWGLNVVLGGAAACGVPAWIVALLKAAKAARNGRVAEAMARGVEAFSERRKDEGEVLKRGIADKMAAAGVSSDGDRIVQKAVKAAA